MSNNGRNGDNNYNQNLQRQNRVAPRGEDVTMHPCNICLETATYAVISFCGHLYCWPCIYQWMESRPQPSLCPICQSLIGRNTMIPVRGTYYDRELVSERMHGVPDRPLCPSIDEQRNHFFRRLREVSPMLIMLPHLNLFISDVFGTRLPGVERVTSLHPALVPIEKKRLPFFRNPYFNRCIMLLMVYLISNFFI